jgi:hypothetical protein
MNNTINATQLPQVNPKVYLTVNQTCQKHTWLSQSSLRYLIFNAETNGFKECIFRLGKKILISEEKLLQWVEKHKS